MLDCTITIPEDDLLEGPWYMDFSDDEEDDSNSRPPPEDTPSCATRTTTVADGRGTDAHTHTSSSGTKLTESRDSGNFTEASLETSSETSCGQGSCTVLDVCQSCGKSLPRGGKEGGITRTVTSKGKQTPPTTPRDRTVAKGQREGPCGSGKRDGKALWGDDSVKCRHCCVGRGGRSGTDVAGNGSRDWLALSSSSGGASDCGCGWVRRRSTSGVLDEEGQILLQILEFPSKVQYIVRASLRFCCC